MSDADVDELEQNIEFLLSLSYRTFRVLKENNLYRLKDLIKKDPDELYIFANGFGHASIAEIERELHKRGLKLVDSPWKKQKEVPGGS